MSAVDCLVKRLLSVAKQNDDEFCFAIELKPQRTGIRYRFVATETADKGKA